MDQKKDAYGADQFATLLVYTFVIYPVANWLISPARAYSRRRGVIYAIAFLMGIALAVNYYENAEVGPNFYRLLQVSRDADISGLKSAKRKRSVQYHPDKRNMEDQVATATFQRLTQAFSILSQSKLKTIYDVLGEKFALYASKIDLGPLEEFQIILLVLSMKYAKLVLITLYLTFSERTGQVLGLCFFGLAILISVEAFIVFFSDGGKSLCLPYTGTMWANFVSSGPSTSSSSSSSIIFLNYIASVYLYVTQITPFEFLTLCHHLYPAFIHCVKCVSNAFYFDSRKNFALLLKDIDKMSEKTQVTLRDEITSKFVEYNMLHNRKLIR